jgi:hypothetical protein
MAGAFAEIIQVAALYPIDTIKVGTCFCRHSYLRTCVWGIHHRLSSIWCHA